MRVLLAEDELRLAAAIARGLRRQGMAVDLAPDGEQALAKARVVRYDVLVLDRELPGVHGDEVCRLIRGERPETGVPVAPRRCRRDRCALAAGSGRVSSPHDGPRLKGQL